MKSWQRIAIILFCVLIPLSRAGTALAEGSDHTSDVFSWVLAKIAALVDNLLDYWVSGNALTDPMGEGLASAIASIVQSLTVLFAQVSTLI